MSGPHAQSELRFTCSECPKSYRHSYSLKVHMRKHTGDMPFRCAHPGCNEVFRWRSGLKNHERHHDPTQNVQRRHRASSQATRGEWRTVPVQIIPGDDGRDYQPTAMSYGDWSSMVHTAFNQLAVGGFMPVPIKISFLVPVDDGQDYHPTAMSYAGFERASNKAVMGGVRPVPIETCFPAPVDEEDDYKPTAMGRGGCGFAVDSTRMGPNQPLSQHLEWCAPDVAMHTFTEPSPLATSSKHVASVPLPAFDDSPDRISTGTLPQQCEREQQFDMAGLWEECMAGLWEECMAGLWAEGGADFSPAL